VVVGVGAVAGELFERYESLYLLKSEKVTKLCGLKYRGSEAGHGTKAKRPPMVSYAATNTPL
jgi:hypothetical protein